MDFVDLNRFFAPIEKDKEVALDTGRIWGSKIAGWLDWPGLLKRRRVVLLAEASCGKTEEFHHQRQRLAAEGTAAFFVRIEDLADHGLDASLGPGEATLLTTWKTGAEHGYFFLDSVDEARLNRKNFDTALRRLARELDGHLGRTYFYISCRISDWRGRPDRDAVTQYLPVPPPAPPPEPEPDVALLSPIFEKKEKQPENADTGDKPDELIVVQLVPLDAEQRRDLARAAEINDTDAFMAAIGQHGLEMFAERPGDILDLIDYWRTHRRFGSLAQMTEHAVALKLIERDKNRPDNDTLTAAQARTGAERVAAALTLGQTFTIRAPAQDIDPALSAGAFDADLILPGLTDKERNALLRRPCFAPSTYGRIRFHHRGTQEYLTASWFNGLLQAGCPKDEVWSLFFADRYGIQTIVPSMRAAAAWLSLKHSQFMDEVIRREPQVLIQYGDPGSVWLHAKKKLLSIYAERHFIGEIADDHMDHRAIWMFARPELADTIRQVWAVNSRQDFRRDLLRMIQEAKISACMDLACEAFNDPKSDEYTRVSALAAFVSCEATSELVAAATHIAGSPDAYTSPLASNFCRFLFPKFLTTSQLLHIIENSRRSRDDSMYDFPYTIEELYLACPDKTAKDSFLSGLAALALRSPFVGDHKRVSRDYVKIAKKIAPIARIALEETPPAQIPGLSLVRALMVAERAGGHESQEDRNSLAMLVRSRPQLNRALFWANVEEVRVAESRHGPPIRFHQVYFGGHCLWGFSESDLGWLNADITNRELADDRQIALSAIVAILHSANLLDTNLPELRAAIAGQPILEDDLAGYLTSADQDTTETELRREMARQQRQHAEETEQAKESWRRFRDEISANPERLKDPARLAGSSGVADLRNITRWLQGHTNESNTKRAVLRWHEVAVAFGQGVAEEYRDGMIRLWRLVEPERPKRKNGNGITTKWANILAFAGIGVEASCIPDWSAQLSAEEAATAVRHACLSEESYPDWLDDLLVRHTNAVLPIMRRALKAEWIARTEHPRDLLYHLGHTPGTIPSVLKQPLFDIVTGPDAPMTRMAELGVGILQRIELDERARSHVARIALARLDRTPRNDQIRVLLNLALLFLTDADAAIMRLKAWIDETPPVDRKARAELALARLFGRNHALVPAVLSALPIPILSALAHYTYVHVSPLDDVHHEGAYSPDTRDDAEGARNIIITALLERPGEEAYLVVKGLADAGIAGISKTRFRELAHGKAERDAEFAPWRPGQVVAMETQHTAPVRTSDDLMRATMSVLADIKRDLVHEDASSRQLLFAAKDEDQVQAWLAEHMRLRAKGRFHVHREAEVAEKKEPDIVISAAGPLIELAIEVKHGGKGWTVRELEDALTRQLVSNYLRAETRRRGILVITRHGSKKWRDPVNRTLLSFEALITRLQSLAGTLSSNVTGSIKAEVVGIDASLTNT